MNSEELEKFVKAASKGDTTLIERLFSKPGGRKFLETTIVLLVNQMPLTKLEKFDYLHSIIEVMDKLEERIKHQKRGERILKQAFDEKD